MIAIGQEVKLIESGFELGKVIAIHVSVEKVTVRLPTGGTVQVPLHLLTPNERLIARKSAPRRRT